MLYFITSFQMLLQSVFVHVETHDPRRTFAQAKISLTSMVRTPT